jgi:hypothetical protein
MNYSRTLFWGKSPLQGQSMQSEQSPLRILPRNFRFTVSTIDVMYGDFTDGCAAYMQIPQ